MNSFFYIMTAFQSDVIDVDLKYFPVGLGYGVSQITLVLKIKIIGLCMS